VSPEQIPVKIGKHRATVYRWIHKIQIKGMQLFLREYKASKKGHRHRKTDAAVKERIYRIREEKRNCCGEKIQYFLKQDFGDEVAVSTIYRILNQKYTLRKRWKNNEKRGTVLKGSKPREVVQVDTVDFGSIYAFTAIDTFTREASVILKKRLDSKSGEEALISQLEFFGKIEAIQRDGGPEFKAHWQAKARSSIRKIRTARPYRKNEQAFIERFNGILRKECLGHLKYAHKDLLQLQRKVQEFLDYYHYERPHLSLNMQTPHQFAMSHLT
jgi:transposase InsO family protein